LVEPLRLPDAVGVGELDVGEPATILTSPRMQPAAAPEQPMKNLDDLDGVDAAVSIHRQGPALLAAAQMQR
jgi:hypothetical protein